MLYLLKILKHTHITLLKFTLISYISCGVRKVILYIYTCGVTKFFHFTQLNSAYSKNFRNYDILLKFHFVFFFYIYKQPCFCPHK
jgi:hypothetical protein